MLLTEEQLKEWVDYERTGHLERWLREHGVRYWHGRRGRICTTLRAVETALEVGSDKPPTDLDFV